MAQNNSNNDTHQPPTGADQQRVRELIASGMSLVDALAQVAKEGTAHWLKLGAK